MGGLLGAPRSAPGWESTGNLKADGDWQRAGDKASVSGPLAADSALELDLRLGAKRTARLSVRGTEDKPLQLTLQAQDGPGKVEGGKSALPDGSVRLVLTAPDGAVLFSNNYCVRPDPASYRGEERQALLARWDKLPSASEHPLRLRVESGAHGVEMWVDGRFVGQSVIAGAATWRLELNEGSAVRPVRTEALTPDQSRFVPLDLQGYSQPDATAAVLPLKAGAREAVGGVPFEVLGVGRVLDVGKSRWLAEKTGFVGIEEFGDPDLSRTAFDRAPENIILSVPTDDYAWAHALVAVDPDPARTPAMTLLLTRFTNSGGDSGGRGEALAISSVRLEKHDGHWPAGVRQVGSVQGNKGEAELPLLEVTIPIESGDIPDVIDETGTVGGRSTQHLDLELTKEMHLVRTKNHSVMTRKAVGKPSAARVYALTLERAPVKVRVLPRRVGHVFYPAEKPGFDLQLHNRTGKAFEGLLTWKLTDFYGQSVTGEKKVSLPAPSAPGEPATVAVDLPHLDLGWYQVELALADAQGNIGWRQHTALALLAPDMRKAGAESPYGTWWFRTLHGGTYSLEEIAPLYQRLGVRHLSPSGDRKPSGAELAKYGLSLSMHPYMGGNPQTALARLDASVAENPAVKKAMIFHESNYGAETTFPPEFIGKPAQRLDAKQRERFDKMLASAKVYAQHIRQKYPDMEIIVGNGGLPFIAGLMQNGFPRDLVDAWGDESTGQAQIPESPPTSSAGTLYYMQEYNKKYGYNKKITTAYEWRARGTNPGNLSELQQAQYFTRDVLRALAYGADSINPGIIHDVGDAYYYSRWGSSGFMHRWPLLTPKISYVAMSVLTQQLDQAQFKRVMPADSPTLHALEFRQGDRWVYVLWVPRGHKPVTITLGGAGALTLTDMNGRTTDVTVKEAKATLDVSDSPAYLHSPVQITALASGPTVLPAPQPAPAVVDAMNDLGQWRLDRTPDKLLETAHFDFPRQVGAISAKRVDDDQKQSAIELTLAAEPNVPWPIGRYVSLKPAKPIELPGKPATVGLWVDGNSNWGRIFFELTDAKGETFYSIGAEDDRWSLGDWEGTQAVNFDGWNYVGVKLPARYASGFYQPQEGDWRSSGGDGVVDYPVSVSRVVVVMRDKIVRVNQPVDVPHRSIRLANLSAR